jgi:hypothetical protein
VWVGGYTKQPLFFRAMPRKVQIATSTEHPVRIGVINHLYKAKSYADIPDIFYYTEESSHWMNFLSGLISRKFSNISHPSSFSFSL